MPLAQWVNDLDIWALRGKAKSQLTERFSATLSGDIMLDRSTASYYTPVYQPNGKFSGQPTNPDLTWSNTMPLNRTTVYGGSLTFKYDLDDNLSLKSVTAVRGMHGPIYYDNDGVTQIKGDSYAGFNQNYETQEFTLNGDYDKLNFVGGLFYFNEFFHNDRLSQSAGSAQDNVGVISHANSYLKTQSYAAFANADYKFTQAFSVTGGLRYTLDHRGFENDGHQQGGAALIYPLPGNNDPALFESVFTDGGKGAFHSRPAAQELLCADTETRRQRAGHRRHPDLCDLLARFQERRLRLARHIRRRIEAAVSAPVHQCLRARLEVVLLRQSLVRKSGRIL